ncbi:hypothetical protein BDP27DRAFT_1342016 [Rhodocollybia butyracea]|uniref:GDP/GTP exchange factor Sec2 N-terminal domain-containing protein n=1 Tax=Rhodocollybia butyracea TaxID=206335 RepID=A0A9P5TYB6_9AGAR|nr:hypothetical protein BDP27DRAFT_1342016 [Rhodocollybia butyracea]
MDVDQSKPIEPDTTWTPAAKPHDDSDPDAQILLISTLRTQITDLYTQVTQLNSKLVSSYDRVSDLEDTQHALKSQLSSSTGRISHLESERKEHLALLNTGALVQKDDVKDELQRLMEHASREASLRALSDGAKAQIEQDLDDLSASLFEQANGMVAEARFEKHLVEQKLGGTEEALKGAMEALGEMGKKLGESESHREELGRKIGKGKFLEETSVRERRFLKRHLPYQEFLAFVGHLRTLHTTSSSSLPAMTTLLGLPFLARIMTEDSDPTLRLDLAPSLNWLSRRSVLAAIHTGNLTIEPVNSTALIQHFRTNNASNSTTSNVISCALCGTPVFPGLETNTHSNSSTHSTNSIYSNSNSSWSTSIFKKSSGSNSGMGITPPPSPPPTSKSHKVLGISTANLDTPDIPTQVYVFRITTPSSLRALSGTITASTVAAPSPPSSLINTPLTISSISSITSLNSSTIYPICSASHHALHHSYNAPDGYGGSNCLARLRTTCSLWAFRVWGEEIISLPSTTLNGTSNSHNSNPNPNSSIMPSTPPPLEKAPPATPPRKRGLWGTLGLSGLGSLTEKAGSWSGSVSGNASRPSTPSTEDKKLPGVPSATKTGADEASSAPVHPSVTSTSDSKPTNGSAAPPPPLPKRNEGRGGSARGTTTSPTTDTNADSTADSDPSNSNSNGISKVDSNPNPDSNNSNTNANSTTTEPNPVISASPTTHSPVHSPRISLPDSRPGTPSSRPGTPSRSVGGVPPPIPRRAVARAPRPMSGSGSPGGAGSRSGSLKPDGGGGATEAAEGAEAKESKESNAVVTAAGTDEKEGKVQSVADGEKAEKELGEKEKKTTVKTEEGSGANNEATASETPETTLTDASVAASVSAESDTKDESAAKENTSASVPEGAQPAGVVVNEGEKNEGETLKEDVAAGPEISTSETKASDTAPPETSPENDSSPPSKPTSTPLDSETKLEGSSPAPAASPTPPSKLSSSTTEPADSPDPNTYITRSTWEERTWAEIVHLKEGMFWARVAGVQDAGDAEVGPGED